MDSASKNECQIQGTTAPGFEPVRHLFENNMRRLAEKHTQLCVYHGGEKVVDLWSSTHPEENFGPDSLVNIFSSGKSLEAVAIAWLVDKGLLEYTATIASHWPEFAAHGKANTTVADLMRHEAGLANFTVSIDPEDLATDSIKKNTVGRIIEDQVPRFRSDTNGKREYHALTRGWIVNELFRRVDPARRTVGEFLREEISGPLSADAVIGVGEDSMYRVSRINMPSLGYYFLQSLLPKFLGRKILHNFFQLLVLFIRLIPALRRRTGRGTPPPITGMNSITIFNRPSVAMGETPSANTHASARGLARIAAMMAAGGALAGTRCLSEKACTAMHAETTEAKMGGLFTTHFTQGGVARFDPTDGASNTMERAFNVGREGFYGWMGFGGSILQWNPEMDIGFGFVPTSMHALDFFNERGKAYQAEVLRCVKGL